MFLEISQNSQENTCARVSFLKNLQTSACNFIKEEALAQAFYCEFGEISRNTFFLQNTSGRLLLKPSILWKRAPQGTHLTFIKRQIITEETKLVETFNNFFSNIVRNLQAQNEQGIPKLSQKIQIPFWT